MTGLQRTVAFSVSLGASLLTVLTLGGLGGGYMSAPLSVLITLMLAPWLAIGAALWYPLTRGYWTRSERAGTAEPPLRHSGALVLVSAAGAAPMALFWDPEIGVLVLAGLLVGGAAYLYMVWQFRVDALAAGRSPSPSPAPRGGATD